MIASNRLKKESALLYSLYIGGAWSPSVSNQTMVMYEPSTGAAIGTISCGNANDIDRAVNAARTAFEGSWKAVSPAERGRLLHRLGESILAHEAELTMIEARDTGKPLSQARKDIRSAARYFEYYGGAADKLHGQTIPYEPGYFVSLIREPIGVTGHILPWNYPAQMFGRTLGPSLAVGNTVVLKPAEDACLSILRMTELSQEVGFPPGVINVVPGLGKGAGSSLASHSGVDFISFTGSPEVGTLVQELAAANQIGCMLELGGKSPQIIFEDADLDGALDSVVGSILQNTGQTCSAASRTLVHESIYHDFATRLVERFRKVCVGTPEQDLDCGPLISARQKKRVSDLAQAALQDGIPVLARGMRAENLPAGGFYFDPIVFGPVPPDSKIAMEEVFGPVLVVTAFQDEAEAIKLANGTDYGLIAGVWTRDGARQLRMARALKCGQVFLNSYGAGGGVELPFGGVKKSGHGREKGMEAMQQYCTVKVVVLKHG
jgi:aldehyde dehydrogenase (NAD+)